MVQSIDGAITVDGRSGPLGGPADHAVFLANRSLADIVLVGSGTVRTEGYGPAQLIPELRTARAADGQPPVPPIAVVSQSLTFDWDSPFFTAAIERPIVITTLDAPEERIRRADRVADVIRAGAGEVDIADAIRQLGDRGASLVVCEGGPTLNAHALAAGVLDEICLSMAPQLVAGDGPRIVAPRDGSPATPWTLHAILSDGDFLVLRYRALRLRP
jgi:riboflavin biosynthesis pyrimidine reductase